MSNLKRKVFERTKRKIAIVLIFFTVAIMAPFT